jgi:hypothetical protein
MRLGYDDKKRYFMILVIMGWLVLNSYIHFNFKFVVEVKTFLEEKII